MFSTTLPLLLTLFLTIVLATCPDTTANPTTYKLYYVTPIPPPATLIAEIPCMKACEKEVQQ
jgi:acyl dehydratase